MKSAKMYIPMEKILSGVICRPSGLSDRYVLLVSIARIYRTGTIFLELEADYKDNESCFCL